MGMLLAPRTTLKLRYGKLSLLLALLKPIWRFCASPAIRWQQPSLPLASLMGFYPVSADG